MANNNPEEQVFVSLKKMSSLTGITYEALLRGCKNGVIPHIRIGTGSNARFKIHQAKFLEQLNREDEGNMLTL